jgi:hypothetical protein
MPLPEFATTAGKRGKRGPVLAECYLTSSSAAEASPLAADASPPSPGPAAAAAAGLTRDQMQQAVTELQAAIEKAPRTADEKLDEILSLLRGATQMADSGALLGAIDEKLAGGGGDSAALHAKCDSEAQKYQEAISILENDNARLGNVIIALQQQLEKHTNAVGLVADTPSASAPTMATAAAAAEPTPVVTDAKWQTKGGLGNDDDKTPFPASGTTPEDVVAADLATFQNSTFLDTFRGKSISDYDQVGDATSDRSYNTILASTASAEAKKRAFKVYSDIAKDALEKDPTTGKIGVNIVVLTGASQLNVQNATNNAELVEAVRQYIREIDGAYTDALNEKTVGAEEARKVYAYLCMLFEGSGGFLCKQVEELDDKQTLTRLSKAYLEWNASHSKVV